MKVWLSTRVSLSVGACLVSMSCLRDDGVVDPFHRPDKPVLRSFVGKALNENHSSLSAERLLMLGNPKIALVWQHITLKTNDVTFDRASVAAVPPYSFSLDILNPPPADVLNSKSVVVGSFWLYSDGDGNGRLDRITHPNLLPLTLKVDSILVAYEGQRVSLMEVADVREKISVRDTFHVRAEGILVHSDDGRRDTLFTARRPEENRYILEYVNQRYRILDHFNPWETFFAFRKKALNTFEDTVFVPGYAFRFEYHHGRRLFPKPGKEEEFEVRLRRATETGLAYTIANNGMLGEAVAKDWLNYPYDGFKQPGTDWVAGRSRRYFIFYFQDQPQLDEVLEAEKTSSFDIEGLKALRRGYNLLTCDDQYRCRVLSSDDSLVVDLGEKWQYFDPPSSPIAFPIKTFDSRPLPDSSLERYQGRYDYQPFRPIIIFASEGDLWGEFPDIGVRRLVAGGSTAFFSPGEDMQVEFLSSADGGIGKVLLYTAVLAAKGSRGVGSRVADSAGLVALAETVGQLKRRKPGMLSKSVTDKLPLSLEYGRDTAMLSYHQESGSLLLTHPRLPPQSFLPLNDSQAYSTSSDNLLEFERDRESRIPGLRYFPMGKAGSYLPNPGYRASGRSTLFPAPATPLEKIVSESDGSGLDSYTGIGGRKRYNCANEYLAQGDGWVHLLEAPDASDSISLQSTGGRLVFRLEGLAGKHVRLELKACGETAAKGIRSHFGLWGGMVPQGTHPIDPARWIDLAKDTLSWEPIPVPGDVYYLEVRIHPVLSQGFRFSLDSYRITSN